MCGNKMRNDHSPSVKGGPAAAGLMHTSTCLPTCVSRTRYSPAQLSCRGAVGPTVRATSPRPGPQEWIRCRLGPSSVFDMLSNSQHLISSTPSAAFEYRRLQNLVPAVALPHVRYLLFHTGSDQSRLASYLRTTVGDPSQPRCRDTQGDFLEGTAKQSYQTAWTRMRQ